MVAYEGLLEILQHDLKQNWVRGVCFCGEFGQKKVNLFHYRR